MSRTRTQTFQLDRDGRSNFALMVALLDIVAVVILFENIVRIVPTYTDADLTLAVTYFD
jgi:hypothetical protein